MDAALSTSALAEVARHLLAAKMFSLASCVMLFYDIFITFGDEVEKIWMKPFSGVTVLWFLNRYLSPLGYIVIIVSFHDPDWSKSRCDRYVLYPEALKIVTAATVGVIFILRLYAIYGRNRVMVFSMSCILLAELAVKIWAFTDGTSVQLPPGLVGCILTGKPGSDRFAFTWIAELVFDTAISFATLFRTITIFRNHRQGVALSLVKVMMRDGIIYFAVIFAANVVTVTLYMVLPSDLKAVNASFSTLITSLMVSRLILNLREQAYEPRTIYTFSNVGCDAERSGRTHITSTIISKLGQPVCAWDDDGSGEVEGNHELMESYPVELAQTPPPRILIEITEDVMTDAPRKPVHEEQAMELSVNEEGKWYPPPTWLLRNSLENESNDRTS